MHARKFTEFKKGKRRDLVITKEYLIDYCCFQCKDKFISAKYRA